MKKNKSNEIEILVIEDEPDVLELIEYILAKEGYKATGFLSTEYVEQFLEEESPSLLIVDRNLPGIEGSNFVSYLRDNGYEVPVIFLTAKNGDKDILDGFDSGGDDYMTKPFKPGELVARVKALLKRSGIALHQKMRYRDMVLDCQKQELNIDNSKLSLTNLEFKLLITFIKNSHQTLSRDFLRDEVWADDGSFNDKTINVALNRLKKKIDPLDNKHYFAPVWGIGYKLS
ncbi:MAG: response regulator transcription factor [Sulfurovaceae bacterium]|nr:response regulator transcription factor [Sulfurovaceae bacterium]